MTEVLPEMWICDCMVYPSKWQGPYVGAHCRMETLQEPGLDNKYLEVMQRHTLSFLHTFELKQIKYKV